MKKEPQQEESKKIIKMDESWKKERMYMGMAGVDPMDIRPPQILLVQKSSDLENLKDIEGKTPNVGQFIHTGQGKIMDSFECYILMAKKGTYVDRNKEDNPIRDQYATIGLLVEDMSIFGYNFRSSALYALSKLFTAVVGMKRPMFSIKCTIGVKKLTNDKGLTWYIPVIESFKPEDDGDKLIEIEQIAQKFEKTVEKIHEEEEVPVNPPDESEEVKPEQIPF